MFAARHSFCVLRRKEVKLEGSAEGRFGRDNPLQCLLSFLTSGTTRCMQAVTDSSGRAALRGHDEEKVYRWKNLSFRRKKHEKT